MPEYRSVYKCRLCGESFEGCGVNHELLAKEAVTAVIFNEDTYGTLKGECLSKHETHFCKDGSFGFADFQGLKKMEEKGDTYEDIAGRDRIDQAV